MSDTTRETVAPSDTVEVQAFAGRPPVTVDLAKAAPFGWWPAVVIALVAFIDRVEVNLIAGALPQIQDHFGFSDAWAGAIPTAASVAGALLVLPAGRLADRAPRVVTISLVVLIWALCSVASGLATSFLMFFIIRIAIGGAGQLYNPPASSLLADYYPARSRAKAYGFERAGYYMGLPCGVILGGAVADAYDWRTVFFVAAVPGLLVAVLVLTVKDPLRGLGDRLDQTRAGDRDAARGVHVVDDRSIWAQTADLLRIPTLRGVTVSLAMLSLGVAGLFYWIPTFLVRVEGVSESTGSALSGAVGGTGIVIGIVLGSRFGDRYHGVRKGWRINVSAVFLLVGALGLTGTVLLPGVGVRSAMIALACIGFAAAIPNMTAANADVLPANGRGMGFAVLTFLVTLGGSAGPLLIGFVSTMLADTFDLNKADSLQFAMLTLLPPLFICIGMAAKIRHTYDEDAARALAAT
ncbi:MFS transporter [Nocardioides sp. cx-173]|uniref:MFS transporter n=1 Tax=Nocardioides sp. cx-173 TaxID=2898796 RepID=UPI001E5B1A36|nr:MFS transporter [Nocardioides sp. cx-173]MCD4524403.1 MFS transporter [Nocardioides sp. cx-173]UGB43109.1 MFS transporter [Nocardioides sp. cx-173]